jgi:hypothetical protein
MFGYGTFVILIDGIKKEHKMSEEIIQELEVRFESKVFLSMEDIVDLLQCKPNVIQNWIKRPDVRKRPPRIMAGKAMRFPKKAFVRRLIAEQKCLEAA